MSAVVLLAPGDVIRSIQTELKDRQISYNIKPWEEAKNESKKEEVAETADKEEGGKGKEEEEKDVKREETKDTTSKGSEEKKGEDAEKKATGSKEEKSDAPKSQEASIRNVDGFISAEVGFGGGSGKASKDETAADHGRRGKATGRDKNDAGRASGDGNPGQWVVATEEIARLIETRLNTNVQVFDKEIHTKLVNIERGLQKELGFTKEMGAEQTEIIRSIKNLNRGKGDQNKRGKGKEEKTTQLSPRIEIEDVLSVKKLTTLIGGKERTHEVIKARETSVSLVSNDVADVPNATAYFTAPTGDTNWKEVARLASTKSNIMAYSSDGKDAARELIHLIDHL
ncbi:VP6 [Pata virus]|nr:VP6 [Pata virus]